MQQQRKIIIQTEALTRAFNTTRAVDSLSFQVPSGIIFGFLGPNGAGKTTTIRMLLGLMEPTSGGARVLGFDTHTQGAEIRARTGALLEHSGVYEHMNAEDNLEFYGRVYQMPQQELRTRIRELLSGMGLWDRRKETVGKWSRGMKQRLALARALLHRPPLVFLDEPTAGLDVVAASEVRDDIAALVAQEGTTVFLTTHNMTEAEKLCSRVAVIRAGKLIATGAPDELMTRSQKPEIEIVGSGFRDEVLAQLHARPDILQADVKNSHLHITLSDKVNSADLVSLLVNEGVQVEEVRQVKDSLEDVFISLVDED